MNKEKLLKLINEDDDIKDAIINILNQENPIPITQEENPINYEELLKECSQKYKKDVQEIKMLKALVEKWKKCFNDEEIKTDTLSKELSRQKESLNQDIVQLRKVKEELTSSNEKLKSKKDELISTNTELKDDVKELKSDNKDIQSSNTKLNKTIDFYKDNFEDELKAYELFTSLSSDTKDSISGIFKDATLEGFLSCGVQDKNISSFWEYIKTELQEDKNSDITSLIQIYDFLFQKYRRAFPMYEVQKVVNGDEFEALSHINHSSSNTVSGTVTKVLLKGYVNTKTSKVMKQSVVKVG